MTEIQSLTGTVRRGIGTATRHLNPVSALIAHRIGLPVLYPGTLNLELPEPFNLIADATLTAEEYNKREWIKLQKCRIGGIQAAILRAQDMAHGEAHLEIVAAVCLRHELQLSDGNSVVVEVGTGERWWRGDI